MGPDSTTIVIPPGSRANRRLQLVDLASRPGGSALVARLYRHLFGLPAQSTTPTLPVMLARILAHEYPND